MKLIENLIGCVIGIFSLILLSFCILLLALFGREAFRWSKEKMKNAKATLQNRWKLIKDCIGIVKDKQNQIGFVSPARRYEA